MAKRKLKVARHKAKSSRRLRSGMGKLGAPINSVYLEDSDGNVYRAGSKKVFVDIILSVDTNIYAANEVLAATQTVNDAFREADVGGILESVTVVDPDHITAANNALTLWFFDAAVSIGTENNAPTITDADALKIQAKVPLAAADFTDFTNSMVGSVGNLNRVIKPITGTKNLAIAATCGSAATPTHAGGVVNVRLGLMLD